MKNKNFVIDLIVLMFFSAVIVVLCHEITTPISFENFLKNDLNLLGLRRDNWFVTVSMSFVEDFEVLREPYFLIRDCLLDLFGYLPYRGVQFNYFCDWVCFRVTTAICIYTVFFLMFLLLLVGMVITRSYNSSTYNPLIQMVSKLSIGWLFFWGMIFCVVPNPFAIVWMTFMAMLVCVLCLLTLSYRSL